MSGGQITMHILDTARGRPAAGVAARLAVQKSDGWHEIGAGVADEDGRIRDLGPSKLEAGNYRIEINVDAYFRKLAMESFFSSITLCFTVSYPAQHFHVPVLMSPFAITTYRGS